MTSQLPKITKVISPTLYDNDYCLWLQTTAKFLREGDLAALDVQNLIEEIEDMSRREKRAVESNLEFLLMHLLKYKYQPEKRSNSWKYTIREHRNKLRKAFRDSPSLKGYFNQVFPDCYQEAKALAADETGLPIKIFPVESPFTQQETLNLDYLPNIAENELVRTT